MQQHGATSLKAPGFEITMEPHRPEPQPQPIDVSMLTRLIPDNGDDEDAWAASGLKPDMSKVIGQ